MTSIKRIKNEINKINNPDNTNLEKLYLIIKKPKPLFNFKLKNPILNNNYFEIINFENKIVLVKMMIDNQIFKIEIEIPDFYPFKPPKIKLNDGNYYNFLKTNNLRKINNPYCLCCSTLICDKNWSPSNGIIHIINEIYQNIYNKKNIIEILHLEKIEKKYLGFNSNIKGYLINFDNSKMNILHKYNL